MRPIPGAMHALVFERAQKGLGRGVIVTVARSTHAYNHSSLLQHLTIRMTGLLTASVRVVEHQISLTMRRIPGYLAGTRP